MKPKETFITISQSSLSSDEWKVLGLLYQPLMGVLAFSLYHSFYHLLNLKNYQSETFTHHFLAELLNEKLDKIEEAKNKLEALNLLSTYKDLNNYVYQLKSPLSPRGFLKDTVLGQFLRTELGPKMYDHLTSVFTVNKIELTPYTEITKSFDDVFSFVGTGDYYDHNMYLGKRNNVGAKIKKQLDFESFIEALPNRVKKPCLVNSWKAEDTIQKLVFVYQFTLDEMVKVYLNTVQPNGDIDLSQLSFKAQTFYQEKRKDLPMVSESIKLNEGDSSIVALKETSPLYIIENYAKNDYQLMATDTVMQLLERNQVEIGIVNALLLHILKFKEGVLPHLNYLEKVLETWSLRGIKTTEDAYNLVLNQKPAAPTTASKKVKQKEYVNPDWVNEYLQELKDEVATFEANEKGELDD